MKLNPLSLIVCGERRSGSRPRSFPLVRPLAGLLAVLLLVTSSFAQIPAPAKPGSEKPKAAPDGPKQPAQIIRVSDETIDNLRFLEKTQSKRRTARPKVGDNAPATSTAADNPKADNPKADNPKAANPKADSPTPAKPIPARPIPNEPTPAKPILKQDSGSPPAASTSSRKRPAPAATISETGDAPATAARQLDDVHPAGFQGIIPGRTKVAELKQKQGDPVSTDQAGTTTTLTYQIGPFPKVEFLARKAIVQAVIVTLSEPSGADSIAQELGLDAFEFVEVPNAANRMTGRVFPERGVLFVYDDAVAKGSTPKPAGDAERSPKSPSDKPASGPLVAQLILERIAAGPFVLRVLYDPAQRYSLHLADLHFAQKIDPRDAMAWWLEAKIHLAIGQHAQGLKAIDKALALHPGNSRFRLTKAELLGRAGKFREAMELSKGVRDNRGSSSLLKAQAELQLGNLIAKSNHDYETAITHHMAAINLAKPVLQSSESPAQRAELERLLIDAHVEVANDVAWGEWKDRDKTTARWLANTDRLIEALLLDKPKARPALMEIQRRQLAAHAGLHGKLDVGPTIKSFREGGESLLKEVTDPLARRKLQWQLGSGLFDAMRTSYARRDFKQARSLGEEAVAHLEPHAAKHDTDQANYLLGRLYFLVGATHAVGAKDHNKAVVWYERAAARLEAALGPLPVAEQGRQGERFVSMGVSYWHTGARKEGLRLTQKGAELVEAAVEKGSLDATALAVPLSNLANMHRSLGNTDQARTLTARAEKLSGQKKR